jgi:hypothetical protein
LNNNYLKLETGMSDDQIKKSKEELEKFELAYFYEGWVFVPNMDKHNRFSVGKLTGKGYQKELENIPKFILDYFNNKKDTSIIGVSYEYDTPRNKKKEIRNNNKDREIVREEENKININKFIAMFKNINPSYELLFKNDTQRASVERLVKKYGDEWLVNLINKLPEIIKTPYAPQITTPYELEIKLGKLKIFLEQEKNKVQEKGLLQL